TRSRKCTERRTGTRSVSARRVTYLCDLALMRGSSKMRGRTPAEGSLKRRGGIWIVQRAKRKREAMKSITKIVSEVIDHTAQRYDTAGDWWFDPDGTLHVAVSKMSDPRYTVLLAMHELTEAILCRHAGVTTEQVDAWDMGEGADVDEPGDD